MADPLPATPRPAGMRLIALRWVLTLGSCLALAALALRAGMLEAPLLHPLRLWPPLLLVLGVSLLAPRWPERPRALPLGLGVPGLELTAALLCVPALMIASLVFAWIAGAALLLAAAALVAVWRRRWVLLRVGPLRLTPLLPWTGLALLGSLLYTQAEHVGSDSWFCGDLERPGVRRIYQRPTSASGGEALEPLAAQHPGLRLFRDWIVAPARGPQSAHGLLIVDRAPPHRHRFVSTGACWTRDVFPLVGRDTLAFVCADHDDQLKLGELDPAQARLGPLVPLPVRAEGSVQHATDDSAGGRWVMTEFGGLGIRVSPDGSAAVIRFPSLQDREVNAVARDPARDRLFVSSYLFVMAGSVTACEGGRPDACREVDAVPGFALGLEFDPAGDRLLASGGWPMFGSLRVLDGETLTLQRSRWFFPMLRETLLDARLGIVVASAGFEGTLRLLDAGTLEEIGRVDLGVLVRGAVLDPERSYLYASSTCGIFEVDLSRWR